MPDQSRSTSAFSRVGRSIVRVCSLSGTYGSASITTWRRRRMSWRRRRSSVTRRFACFSARPPRAHSHTRRLDAEFVRFVSGLNVFRKIFLTRPQM